MHNTTNRTLMLMASLLIPAACDDTPAEDPDTEANEGVNGTACVESRYNCKLRKTSDV
mgnify:FL=1